MENYFNKKNMQDNNYIDVELDEDEIQNLIAQGYKVEELPKAQFGKAVTSLMVNPFERGMFNTNVNAGAPDQSNFGLGIKRSNMFPQWSKENDVKTDMSAQLQIPYAMNRAPGIKGNVTTAYTPTSGSGNKVDFTTQFQGEAGYSPQYGANMNLMAFPHISGSNVPATRWRDDKYYAGAFRAGVGPQLGMSYAIKNKAVQGEDNINPGGGGLQYGARGFVEYSPTDWLKLKLEAQGMFDPVTTGVRDNVTSPSVHFSPGVNLSATMPLNQLKRKIDKLKPKDQVKIDNDRYTPRLKEGGVNNNYIDIDADDDDIANYIAQGYQVEELPKAQLGQNVKNDVGYRTSTEALQGLIKQRDNDLSYMKTPAQKAEVNKKYDKLIADATSRQNMSYNTANTAGTKQVKNIINTSNEATKIKADKIAKEKAEARYYAAELAKNKGKVPDSKYAYLDERAAPVADNTRVDPSYLPFAQQEIKFANQAQDEEERQQENDYRTQLAFTKDAQKQGYKNTYDQKYNPKPVVPTWTELNKFGYDDPNANMASGAAGSADWFWTLPLAIPAAIEGIGALAGTALGTAADVGFGLHGASMVDEGYGALQKADAMPENTYEQKLAKLDAQNAAYENMGWGAANMLPLGIRGLKGSKSLSNVDDAYTFAKNPITINKSLTGKTPLELPIGERPFGYGNQDVYNNMIKEFDKANGPIEGLGKITEGTNILPSKDPGFISELNAAKFKMQSGLDSPVGPQIGRSANRWRDIDRVDLDVPSIEELQNFGLDESALAFPANVSNETILSSQQRAMIKNIEGAKQTALSKGDTELAKQFDTYISKIKNDELKKFTETPYTGEKAMSSTTLNYSGNEIPDLPNYLSDEQISKGYDLVQDKNRIFLNKNGKSAGQIELMSSDSPMISSNGKKFGSIDIDIDPSHRGKNLSKPMYEALLDMANKKGLDGIISTDNLLDSPAQSKAIRKYFDGEYSSDPELLKQKNASIAEMNKQIEEDNLAWGDNDPLIEKVDKVYILKPKKSNIKNEFSWPWNKSKSVSKDKQLELLALKEKNTLDTLGHNVTEMRFNDWKNQKLLDLETPEGQRRIEKLIDDNTSKFLPPLDSPTPITVNDYIDHFKNLKYNNITKPMQKDILKNVDKVNDITDKITKLTKDRDQYYDVINEDNWMQYNKEIERLDAEITMLENDKTDLIDHTTDVIEIIEIENKKANYTRSNNEIFIGESYQTPQELPRVIGHEGSHATSRIPENGNPNSKMDRDLIKELKLTKRLPKHLKKNLSVKEIRNTPSGASQKGAIDKAWNPKEWWKAAKSYWEEGSTDMIGASSEPTSFIAEVRAGMKEDGIIKNDYDPITEDMLKAYYEDYIKKPLHHSSLRVFDIMENDASNFKVLKKHINDLLSLAPYLIPAGIGVGAAAASGEDNTPQYKYGGNVNKLQKFIK